MREHQGTEADDSGSWRPRRLVVVAATLLAALLALGCDVGQAPDVAVASADADDGAFEEPVEVEVIESGITVELTVNGYAPESDVLIGIHGDIDPAMYLISPAGEVLEAWRITNRHGETLLDRRVLPNGNIMFLVLGDGAYEMTRDGEIVWAYRADDITHHAEILPNGNVLVVGALCDCVREIDYETLEEVWSWSAADSFPEYDSDDIFRGTGEYNVASLYASTYTDERLWPDTWAHANYAQVLENDNVIVSLRNFDLVVEVNREGEVVWSFGPGIIKHQHTPVDLEDGTMLVFDNGNHRVIRFDRMTGEVVWAYDNLDSPIMGDANLLADGNYKVVDSIRNTVKIVSPEAEMLWSITIEPPGEINGIYRAHFPDLED
jgi:hypothetical protein